MRRELHYSPQPARPDPDWSALAHAHDRSVWLHLLALRVPPELARDLKQEVWATLIRKWRDGELDYLQMPGLALRQAEFLARRVPRQQRDVLADNVIDLADQRSRTRDAEALLVDRAKLKRTSRSFWRHP
ncbi:MAG TPA: hypothetical protein VJV79_11970 [Polyangiaceae bacterium]|nr:hypothetical protein [Polyangiaceae bacterium]